MAVNAARVREIEATIQAILAHAVRGYIGRTNHPERRLIEHMALDGRNKLFTLHWASDVDDIAVLERTMLARFADKLENAAQDARGRRGTGPNALYISWVWARGLRNTTTVNGVAPRAIVQIPDEPEGLAFHKDYFLFTPLDRYGAENEAARFWRARGMSFL